MEKGIENKTGYTEQGLKNCHPLQMVKEMRKQLAKWLWAFEVRAKTCEWVDSKDVQKHRCVGLCESSGHYSLRYYEVE